MPSHGGTVVSQIVIAWQRCDDGVDSGLTPPEASQPTCAATVPSAICEFAPEREHGQGVVFAERRAFGRVGCWSLHLRRSDDELSAAESGTRARK